MDGIDPGSTSWYIILLFAGLAVGVAIAMVQKIIRKD